MLLVQRANIMFKGWSSKEKQAHVGRGYQSSSVGPVDSKARVPTLSWVLILLAVPMRGDIRWLLIVAAEACFPLVPWLALQPSNSVLHPLGI